MLVAIIVLIGVSESENMPAWFAQAWMPVVALNFAAIALGLLGGKLSGLNARDSLTVSIEMCVKNSTLGLTIALSLLGNAEIAVPVVVYGLLMYVTVALVCWYGRRLPN